MAPSTAATSSAGPVAQPIFQPVNEKVLPELEIVSVRSAMPGSVAIGTCSLPVEDEVLVDLVGDHDQVVLDREPGDALELGAGQHGAGRVVRAC